MTTLETRDLALAPAFPASLEQEQAPYLDALLAYSKRDPSRLHVPGHKGGSGADELLLEALGEEALGIDIPAFTHGVDVGSTPTPLQTALRLAAEAWGARRSWFLVNGASEGASPRASRSPRAAIE